MYKLTILSKTENPNKKIFKCYGKKDQGTGKRYCKQSKKNSNNNRVGRGGGMTATYSTELMSLRHQGPPSKAAT